MASRREALKTLSLATGAGLLAPTALGPLRSRAARAQEARVLDINLLGFALGIHVPAMAAIVDLLPKMQGYGPPNTQRMDQIRTLTQTLVAGAAEVGETDPITTFRAVEAGADLKIIGLWYMNTSLVFVADADHVKTFKDLEKPDNVIAINSRGDITEVMLVGPLLREGVDIGKLNFVEVGGSGARMRALLAGRVQAVPVHFDQANAIMKEGNYRILLEPWKEYDAWINEVWVTNGEWLRQPGNERAAVDLLKATITGFRKANDDFAWYADAYRRHATLADASQASDESIRPLWESLSNEIGAWPQDMDMRREQFEALLPVYKAARAVEGTVDVQAVVDPSFMQQALDELRD